MDSQCYSTKHSVHVGLTVDYRLFEFFFVPQMLLYVLMLSILREVILQPWPSEKGIQPPGHFFYLESNYFNASQIDFICLCSQAPSFSSPFDISKSYPSPQQSHQYLALALAGLATLQVHLRLCAHNLCYVNVNFYWR